MTDTFSVAQEGLCLDFSALMLTSSFQLRLESISA